MSDVSLLEGRADSVRAGGCVAGTDCDFFRSTVAVAIMVDAVAYIAGNTLDVTLILVTGVAGFKRIKNTHFFHSAFRYSEGTVP